MKKFELNTQLFVKRNIATFLRKPKTLAWLHALLSPWKIIRDEFDNGTNSTFVGKINYRLSFSSQTGVLEYLLGLEFGNDQIIITNFSNTSPSVYVGFYHEVGHNKFLGYDRESGEEIYLSKPIELTSDSSVDFEVNVPSSCFIIGTFATQQHKDSLAKMESILKKYMLSSRKYSITN